MTIHEISDLFLEVVSLHCEIDKLETKAMTASSDECYKIDLKIESLWSRREEIRKELAKDDIRIYYYNGTVRFDRTIHHKFIG